MSNGLPIVAVLFNSSFALLSYMGINAGSGLVFTYFANMAAIAGLVNWFGIAVTYIRFYNGMKAQGYVRSQLPYHSKYQPFAAWYAVCSISFILLVSHFSRI
jgi:yeast amino acid transporter